jgi:hypothetical protein
MLERRKFGRLSVWIACQTPAPLTEPEDPEKADEAKLSGSQGSHRAFAEEIDNQS